MTNHQASQVPLRPSIDVQQEGLLGTPQMKLGPWSATRRQSPDFGTTGREPRSVISSRSVQTARKAALHPSPAGGPSHTDRRRLAYQPYRDRFP